MLTKHVLLKNISNDNVRRLGNYIADASHKGEKCLETWSEGCLSPDYQSSIFEIEATQALNTRTKKEKTYHLLISFRAGDEEKITADIYRDIEKTIAKTLGFENHQRLCGIHQNTNNIHMHIAYNMINPVKFTRHEPYRDQPKMREAAKILCEKHGLSFDEPKSIKEEKNIDIAQRAAAMEAHTGEQSFQSFALQHKKDILNEIAQNAKNWKDIHSIFAKYGMIIKPRGNGLIITNQQDIKGFMKASSLDRSLSKSNMIKAYGDFEKGAAKSTKDTKDTVVSYTKKPLNTRNSARDELYKKYKQQIEEKKRKIAEDREKKDTEISEIFLRYNRVTSDIRKETFSKKAYYSRIFAVKPILQQQLAEVKKSHKIKIDKIHEEYPFYSWHDFLKHESLNSGNIIAQDILFSKNKANEFPKKQKKRYCKLPDTVTAQNKDVKKMLFLVTQHNQNSSFKTNIDNRGNIIYRFKNGGIIRDCGDKLYFITHKDEDNNTQDIATKYALAKFGKHTYSRGNCIEKRDESRAKTYKQPNPAIIRDSARNGLRKLSKLNVVFSRRKEKTTVLLHDNAQHDLGR